jgi:molecular chaperone DnaK
MADSLIFQTEKQMKEFDEKMTEENKTELNEALEPLKKAYSEKNIEEIEPAMEKLNETWSKISTELYSKTSESTNEPVSAEDGGAQDVQFEEVKE